MPLELGGTGLAVDFEDYLVDPAQWNKQVAGLEHRLKP